MIDLYKENRLYIAIFLVLIVAFFTYFKDYYKPNKVFWDENYHIASAQKYIEGVAFKEPHPPLGKLLIALGEVAYGLNKDVNISHFVKTDHIKKFPKRYSFKGVRFIPTLLATFSAVLFFLILYQMTKHVEFSLLFSSLYLFDNALIVHSRSAMLEGSQIFFILLSISYYFYMINNKKYNYINFILLGIFIGLSIAVKVNGLILILLLFFIFFYYKKDIPFNYFQFLSKNIASFISIFLVFALSYYVHFSLSNKLPTNKNYHMTKEYREVVKNQDGANLKNFWFMFVENLKYTASYSKNVPKFNPCKKGENGSFCLTWPFGNKSINYRWEKKDGKVKYLYLQGNPLIWFFGFFGLILSFIIVAGRFINGSIVKDQNLFSYMSIFLTFYISYMIVMYNIPRVMYLYHYFIPLLFTLFLSVVSIFYIFKDEIENGDKVVWISLIIFVVLIIYVFNFFSPLCYYKPLNTYDFIQRIWFDFWKLAPVR